jgi:diadenosine tetraphosphate (Ap4A) HIT family hydrolase
MCKSRSSGVGLEVPHAHIHLIPLNKMEDMNFRNERLKLRTKNIQRFKTQLLILKNKENRKVIFYDFL